MSIIHVNKRNQAKFRIKMNPKYVNACVNNVEIQFEADSGSDINLFSRTCFRNYCKQTKRRPKLNKCDKPIYAANDTAINSIGYFYATISNPFKSVKSRIYVMSQGIESISWMNLNVRVEGLNRCCESML